MNSTRQDAWTKEEDLLLAETVLHYIREGKTQLEAFKKVGQKLTRTSAACGFRWNATIRKRYERAIQLAKEERKSGTIEWEHNHLSTHKDPQKDHIDTAILLLKEMKHTSGEDPFVYEQLQKENEILKRTIVRYEEVWKEMQKLWAWIGNKDS